MRNKTQKPHPEVLKLFNHQALDIAMRVDKAFVYLLILQWVASFLVVIFTSPKIWFGTSSLFWESLLVGFVLGGIFALFPSYLVKTRPGQKITRFAIASGQMSFSVFFIFLSEGRPESHFHVYVSLAALAFYKDLSVLWFSGLFSILDHLIRGYFSPDSIYQNIEQPEWRWVEHGTWIIFENLILTLGIQRIRTELFEMASSKFELIQARERALKSSSLKSSFLSNMSHEIRTPLNSILGFSEILKETKLDEEQVEFVNTIHRCSDTLLHLINDILDISKIENGLMQIDRHRFHVRQLHEDIYKMFSAKCMQKGLAFEVKLSEDLAACALGDSYRLRQVLMNLVSNAIKFTDQGKVTIEVSRNSNTGHYVWVVHDTGKGIHRENIAKLFRPFSQEDSSISRRFGGTGLGLVISKNLVNLMGGDITVNSKLGEGSAFSFSLPIEEV